MRSSVVYGIIAALITWFFMYLDTKLLDNPKTRATYIKNMSFVGMLVGFGIYSLGEDRFDQAMGVNFEMGQSGSGGFGLDDDMYIGLPDF